MQKNKQLRLFFILTILLFFSNGCSSKEVINQYVLSNTSLTVSFIIIDNEGNLYDGKKELNISKDIKSFSFLINIKNPNRLSYQIWLETLTENKRVFKKLFVANIETGKRPYRVECELDQEKASFIVSFKNSKEQTIFELLPLEYQVQQQEKEVERR